MLRLVIISWLLAMPAVAEEVVAGLSQSRVSITTNFDGSEILIFGAVKREERIAEDPPLHVVITVEGPKRPVAVRRKEKRYGIWVNRDVVDVDLAPTFYSVSTTGPWDAVVSDTEDLRHQISTLRAIRSVGASIAGSEDFTDALIRIRSKSNLYQTNIGSVELTDDTLFNTSVQLPANLTEGDYKARFILTRGGRVLDSHETVIAVQKVGLERFLFRLAYDQPLIYGLMSLAIAIAAGWVASAAFRFLRT